MQDDPALPGPAATAASSASDATLPPHPVHSHNGHSCHGHGHSHGYDHGHGHQHPHFNDEEEAEAQRRERQHLQEVVLAFLEYDKYAGQEVERRWQHLCQLPPGLAATLPPDSLASNLHRQRAAVGANQAFLEAVVQGVEDVGPGDESLLDVSAACTCRCGCVVVWGGVGRVCVVCPVLIDLSSFDVRPRSAGTPR